MSTIRGLGVVSAVAFLAFAGLIYAQSHRPIKTGSKPSESEHTKGSEGLEAWTLSWPLPDEFNHGDERFAFTLVLARDGHEIRRIEGEPIIWKWIFWSGGKQVAYETGPLHFDMTCVLTDVESGKTLATFDCYHELPPNPPKWVGALEKQQ